MRNPRPLYALLTLFTMVLALAATAGCSDRQAASSPTTVAATSGSSCGVSELKANPEKYLGPVSITGRAAKVYTDDSVVEIADEKACCAVYLFVPFTEAQQAKLGTANLYSGTLPAVGAEITADAELTKVEKGYALQVKQIRSGGTVLVAMK